MRQHLELHFQSDEFRDERVLAIYPSAMRRRVLRHLYMQPLRQCYLFKKCKAKFLDAILMACRTDLFMPGVQLISEGDIVHELCIVIEGDVQVIMGGSGCSSGNTGKRNRRGSTVSDAMLGGGSARRGSTGAESKRGGGSVRRSSQDENLFDRGSTGGLSVTNMGGQSMANLDKFRPDINSEYDDIRSTSDCFGEVAFFSEMPSTEAVWTNSVVRVLVVPKSAYETLASSYASQIKLILTNLKSSTEQKLLSGIQDAINMVPRSDKSIHTRLEPYMDDDVISTVNLPAELTTELKCESLCLLARSF